MRVEQAREETVMRVEQAREETEVKKGAAFKINFIGLP
jgi:hypothetical protein